MPKAPDGWSGPVAVGATAALIDCLATYPTQRYARAMSPTCKGATGVTCSSTLTVTHHSATTCRALPLDSQKPSSGFCATADVPSTATRVTVDGSTVPNSGQCAPQANRVFPPPSFATQLLACEGASALSGCEDDAFCLPLPEVPFEPTLCIHRAADSACPAELPARSVY